MADNISADTIAKLGRKYLWWKPVEGHSHSETRIIAQIMNLGTYEDILLLEQAVQPARLADVMLNAAAGWFSERSWEFWRGRLSLIVGTDFPPSLHDEHF